MARRKITGLGNLGSSVFDGVRMPAALNEVSPALAVAQRILGSWGEKGKEPALADQFVASTYSYAKRLGLTAHEQKSLEPMMAAYRDDMRRAHRFVLDDDFTRYATEISSTLTPEKCLSRLQYATLPYETTWIECDLPTKVRTMRRM